MTSALPQPPVILIGKEEGNLHIGLDGAASDNSYTVETREGGLQ